MYDGFTVYSRICFQRGLVSGNDEKQNVEAEALLRHKLCAIAVVCWENFVGGFVFVCTYLHIYTYFREYNNVKSCFPESISRRVVLMRIRLEM